MEGIKERKVLLSESSIDYASWWTGQILAGDPIILFTLNLLPDSAGADKRRLEELWSEIYYGGAFELKRRSVGVYRGGYGA